jgi:hypothetical protein
LLRRRVPLLPVADGHEMTGNLCDAEFLRSNGARQTHFGDALGAARVYHWEAQFGER